MGSGDRLSMVPQSPPHLGYPALCILGHGCHGDAHLSLQQEHWGLLSSVHCSGFFHSSPALSRSRLQAGRQKEITQKRPWGRAGCIPCRLPAPTSLDGTGFVLSSTRDLQKGQVWKMEHHTSGGKCREEGIGNQALCPAPPALCPCCSPPPQHGLCGGDGGFIQVEIKQQQVRQLGEFQGEYWLWESVCGAAVVAPASHRAGGCHRAREALAGRGQRAECHLGAVGHVAAEDGAMRRPL